MSIRAMSHLILAGTILTGIVIFGVVTGMEFQARRDLTRECLVEVGPQLGAKDYCYARAILEMREAGGLTRR